MPQQAQKRPAFYPPDASITLPPDTSALSPDQMRGIELLLAGKTVTDVANILGKDRKTIYRWRQNPYFSAELNRMQGELLEGTRSRLRGLAGKAIDVIDRHLDEGSLKAAVELMKAISFYGQVPMPNTQTDPELIVKQQAESMAAAEKKNSVSRQ